MKGEYLFRVRGKRIRFSFKIRRNITVIQGNSATGKTTLLSMMYEYLRAGRESGYSVQAGTDYFVYLRDEVGRDWTDVLFPLHNTIIFIEENNNFIFSQEFAEFVKDSGNYFVLVTRAPLKMLPYSVHEIYEIVVDGQHADLKESWHTLRELYSNFPLAENNHLETILTEDTNSGFEFSRNHPREASTTHSIKPQFHHTAEAIITITGRVPIDKIVLLQTRAAAWPESSPQSLAKTATLAPAGAAEARKTAIRIS